MGTPVPVVFILTYVFGGCFLAAVSRVALRPAAAAPGGARSPGSSARWVLARVVLVGSALHLAVQLAHQAPLLWDEAATRQDVANYYHTVQRAARGDPLYRPWPEYGPHFATDEHPYPHDRHPYPPFLTAALTPLAGLGPLEFGRAWYVVLFAAFWVYAAALARLATGRVTAVGVVVAGGALGFTPGAWTALQVANVEPVLWALFGAALAFPALRGFGLAASAMVKVYAAWPLLLAVRLEGWRVLRSAAAAVALGTLAGCLALGPAVFFTSIADWARHMLPVIGQGSWRVDTAHNGINVSLSLAVLRLARRLGWEYVAGPLPGWARLYLTVVGIAAPLLAMWWTRRLEPALRYALVTVAAVAFAPLCWTTYLPLLLAPLALWIRRTNREREGAPQMLSRARGENGAENLVLH